MIPSIHDIQNMSDEEIKELNRTLGIQVMKRFAYIMGIKWAIIFGLAYISKKARKIQ